MSAGAWTFYAAIAAVLTAVVWQTMDGRGWKKVGCVVGIWAVWIVVAALSGAAGA